MGQLQTNLNNWYLLQCLGKLVLIISFTGLLSSNGDEIVTDLKINKNSNFQSSSSVV